MNVKQRGMGYRGQKRLPLLRHKAVAEVSGRERLVVVSHGCQSKNNDQLTN